MAAERLSMRKVKEVLRLRAAGHSIRAIARSLAIALGTVHEYQKRAARAGLSWPEAAELTDAELEARLFERALAPNGPRPLLSECALIEVTAR